MPSSPSRTSTPYLDHTVDRLKMHRTVPVRCDAKAHPPLNGRADAPVARSGRFASRNRLVPAATAHPPEVSTRDQADGVTTAAPEPFGFESPSHSTKESACAAGAVVAGSKAEAPGPTNIKSALNTIRPALA